MKITALLPMKAHSERVPGKNFKILGHKPLFQWILDALLESDKISDVVINTDAQEELLQAGFSQYTTQGDRVTLRDRKPELVGDFVSMNRILEDDISATDAEVYLMTHVTNPFISSSTIDQAIDAYMTNDAADSVFSVNRFQTRFYSETGKPLNHDPNNLVRTQDLEPWYEENSCLYIFSRDSFARTDARIGQHPVMFATPRFESVDIDEPEDWELAQILSTTMFKP